MGQEYGTIIGYSFGSSFGYSKVLLIGSSEIYANNKLDGSLDGI